jgi:cellobiose phosphorylase
MVNVWGLYNSLITIAWSRSASLIYNGDRDGLGYRDTVQDILGVIAAVPEEARRRLELMLTGQVASGGAMPIVSQFNHNPGHEACPPDEEYRSDDCLWLFNTVPAWVAETGETDFYFKILPFADHGAATVLGHLRRALEFNLAREGAHGLPCGLKADWNDCIRLGYHGESIFVTFQVRYGLLVYADISDRLGETIEAEWARLQLKQLDAAIRQSAWDGEWFRWAIAEDGAIYGSKGYPEGQVYINTQAWAVISGAATKSQAECCMNVLNDRLATEYGIAICDPPLVESEFELMRAVRYNPGTKENGGIFNHTQSWAVMAECMLGHGDRAYEYHRAYMPAAQNDRAEIRQVEPYVHCQSTSSKPSPKLGQSRLPWLTGAAAWTYYSATQWILGLRPELAGFRVDPCVPSDWDGFEANRILRGNNIRIVVRNPNRVCKGIATLSVDGVTIDGCVVGWDRLHDGSLIEAVMGNTADAGFRYAGSRSLVTSGE